MPKPTIYLETTVIGYLTNRPSNNITIESHRQLTHRWWNEHRADYALSVSQIVWDEISQGDPTAVNDRLALIDGIPRLSLDATIALTASNLVRIHALPPKALHNALHIAVCAHHKIDILLTWNCAYIANPHILKLVRGYFAKAGLPMPEVATPEALLGADANGRPNR